MITYRNLGRLGRFGNELFQYAGTRLYAHLNGFSSTFPAWEGSREIFEDITSWTPAERCKASLLPTIQLNDVRNRSPLQRIGEILHVSSRTTMQNLWEKPRDQINIYGYLQDPHSLELLSQHRDTVRSWFRFSVDLETACRDACRDVPRWTAVHLRRGDFVKRGLALPIDVYIDRLRKDGIANPLYIASDDPSIAAHFKEFAPCKPNVPPGVSAIAFDFWMLAKAQKIYGCGSTFSWWGAYLSGHDSYISPSLTHTWPSGYSPILSTQHL